MRYIGMTLKYLFKNFIFIFFFAILPSYFFARSCDIDNLVAVVKSVVDLNFNLNFFQLFSYFSLFSVKYWYFAIIAFALTVLCMAMLLSLLDKHMRIGTRSFRDLFQRIDYNIGSTFYILLLAAIFYELWALVSAGFISLVVMIIANPLARCIICVMLVLALMVALCLAISQFILWIPCRHITGYGFIDSLVYSTQLNAGKRGVVFLSVFIPYIVSALLQCAVAAVSLFADISVGVFLAIELIYVFVFLYFNVLMYVTFFDANGEERMDLKKKNWFSPNL